MDMNKAYNKLQNTVDIPISKPIKLGQLERLVSVFLTVGIRIMNWFIDPSESFRIETWGDLNSWLKMIIIRYGEFNKSLQSYKNWSIEHRRWVNLDT